MPTKFDEIIEKIELLRQKDPDFKIHGAKKHRYRFRSPLEEEEIRSIEEVYRITLPDDYRDFLCLVGDGGAGPHYGILPLRETVQRVQEYLIDPFGEYADILERWQNGRISSEEAERMQELQKEFFDYRKSSVVLGPVDPTFFAKPFPLTGRDALDAVSRKSDTIDADYPLPGSLPISHQGCGWMSVLVLTGEQRGLLWTGGEGWFPEWSERKQSAEDFLEWYQDWLDSSIDRMSKS